jgi:hypothetical protein
MMHDTFQAIDANFVCVCCSLLTAEATLAVRTRKRLEKMHVTKSNTHGNDNDAPTRNLIGQSL